MSQVICFTNARLVREGRLVQEDLWIVDGKIASPQAKATETRDLQGLILAPGYIDLQLNGAFGCDFSTDPSCLEKVAQDLLQYGVTSFLATIISGASYSKILPQLNQVKGLLGIHLEGPFLNPEKAGAHHQLLPVDEKVYGSLKGVKLVTLAPELPGAVPFIQHLRREGIKVAAGHTQASYEEALHSFEAGVSLVTHLFNAMTPLSQRAPGIAGAALTTPGIFYTIIVDGQHLHPAMVKLAWQANPKGLVLITDGMAAMGLTEGHYILGGRSVEVTKGRACLTGTNTLAGSIVPLDQVVRNLRSITGCTPVQAIEAATLHPAQVLGISAQKGTLTQGADADLVFLDDDLFVKGVYS